MSKDKNKAPAAKPTAAKTPPAKPVPAKVAPLFRKIDWLTLGITFAIVWGIYLVMLAPNQTLEDSGELCTGSFYAGIPHPPGYPFWAIYSWVWTVILPFGSVAWRVEMGESFAVAMGCGLLAFMVSRGSSMLIEGIEELKTVTKQWERAICVISGTVAGLLLGLDSFVWKEAVVINRIALFGMPWLVVVLLCLMRWIYAPNQKLYLYLALFVFGICATIHQTLIVAAMGIEVLIAVAHPRLGRDLLLGNSIIYVLGLVAMKTGILPILNNTSPTVLGILHVVGIGSIVAGVWLCMKTKGIGSEWKTVVLMGVLWIVGASFYFYEPISGMTNPPMEWGYPRTVEGFFHALTRGQYEKATATNILQDPMRFVGELGMLVREIAESFNWVYILIALLPFLFLFKMKNRERAWIIGLTAIYLCLAVLLVILLQLTPDRQSSDETKVFFCASHAIVAIMIGYGLTLTAAYMATHYGKFRRWGLLGGGIAAILALYCLVDATGRLYFGPAGQISLSQLPHWILQAFAKDQYGSPVFANLILVAMPIIFIGALLVYRTRGPVLILLCIFATMPLYSGVAHWYKSEERNHWFGYWFGHDMFTPPFGIYPEMTRNTILFGGTDPGRFCPTYMIFCESFIPPRCKPMDPNFDRRDVYIITQNALADNTYLEYIRAQYFRSSQNALGLDTPFFRDFVRLLGPNNSVVRALSNVAYYLLDVPFTKWGAHVEARRRAEGVYPPVEIYTPTPEDSQDSFQGYMEDAQRRYAHDMQFPNEMKQMKPGEDFQNDNGRVQVSGQVAVMMINGLLCKIIFDHNPTNDFYVEESFPLDWMYPYETPSGIIMKINRNPLPELSDDVFKKDYEFWGKYSDRLIGNWITYDTSVKQIADFAEKVYLGNNYAGFKGDRKFVRDDDAQKAFSKLRSSQAGMFAWRLSAQCPPEYRQKTDAATQALVRETDYAFKQSFAFCPYSPEAVYRYVNFLLQLNRIDDALLVAQTCLKLDPYNPSIEGLIQNLKSFQKQAADNIQARAQLQQMETEANVHPTNFQNTFKLATFYWQIQQTNRANELFDRVLADPALSYDGAAAIAQFYAQTANLAKLETALQKLAAIKPAQPEPRYDLAALQAILGKNSEALQNLQASLDLNAKRLKTNSAARDLLIEARKDERFNALRNLPEFQKLVPPN